MKKTFGRSTLRKGLLFGAPLALSVQCDARDDGEDPYGDKELVVEIDPGDYALPLNDCLDDRDACAALCEQILLDTGQIYHPNEAVIHECNVTKQAAAVEVEMAYTRYPMAAGCGVVTVDPSAESTTIGAHFAALVELEAASVHAFVQLARDLSRHGAPPDLVHSALRAAHDEGRHTAQARALARAWGGTPRELSPVESRDRDLFQLCVENTIDGCIHETFGAAVATHQARHATDPFIRSTMKSIARDERRHADLAEAVDRWARPRLAGSQQRALETIARYAAHVLAANQSDVPPSVAELAGFPSAGEARGLVKAIEAQRRARWV